jgi:hypothetical protein
MDSTDKIRSMVRRMEEANCPAGLWQCDDRNTEMAIHSDLLPYVDWSSATVAIVYFCPEVGLKDPDKGITQDNLEYRKSVVYRELGLSKTAVETWRKIFVEKICAEDAFRFFRQNYPNQGEDTVAGLLEESDALKRLTAWEELESGLPQIY